MLNIPKNWNEVTIQQYNEILDIKKQLENPNYDLIEYQIDLLAILCDIDVDSDDINDLSIEEVNNIINSISFLNRLPSTKFLVDIGNGFKFKKFDNLTLGEFIDIEYFFANDSMENFTNILTILYRKYKFGEWGDIIFEPYDVINYETRQNEFLNIPIGYVYGVLNAYIQFRTEFMERYSLLFEPEIEEDDFEDLDPRIKQLIAEEEAEKNELEEKIQKKWSWENVIYNLANKDITKVNDITNLGLIFVFNMLSLRKELNIF